MFPRLNAKDKKSDFDWALNRLKQSAWLAVKEASHDNCCVSEFFVLSNIAKCLTEAAIYIEQLRKMQEERK